MGLASGVHHLAMSTADMKGHWTFFTDVLGAELKALYWMHGVPNARHGFVKLNDSSYVEFVEMPTIADIPSELKVTVGPTVMRDAFSRVLHPAPSVPGPV